MDIRGWDERYRSQAHIGTDEDYRATRLVVQVAGKLQPGKALDLACGTGRNALWLASQGWQVEAIDGSPAAIHMARERSAAHTLEVDFRVADLQQPSFLATDAALLESQWDLITICYYLQLDLMERAKAALRPGGALLVIVHTTEGDEEPTPSRLQPGELVRYFEGWQILHHYEGRPDDPAHRRAVSELVARRPDQADFAR